MDKESLFSKTGKGLLEIKNKLNRLPKEQLRVLILVDGKAKLGDIVGQTRLAEPELRKIITQLCDAGFIKELIATEPEQASGSSAGGSADAEDDLDFTRVLGPAKPKASPVDSGAGKAPAGGQALRARDVPPAPSAEVPVKAPAPQEQRQSAPAAPSPEAAPPPAPTAFDFDAELAALKRTHEELPEIPAASEEPARPAARQPAPPLVPKPAPQPAAAAPPARAQDSHAAAPEDQAEAFERARKQAEQHAREEAIRLQQETRERRARAARKPK